MNHSCSHLHTIRTVTPSALGCEECLAVGDKWLHLRIFRTCGHVVAHQPRAVHDLHLADAGRFRRELTLGPQVHPDAIIHAGACVERSVIGPGAVVHTGAVLRDSIVWPGCEIAGEAVLDECVVFSSMPASGSHRGEDI